MKKYGLVIGFLFVIRVAVAASLEEESEKESIHRVFLKQTFDNFKEEITAITAEKPSQSAEKLDFGEKTLRNTLVENGSAAVFAGSAGIAEEIIHLENNRRLSIATHERLEISSILKIKKTMDRYAQLSARRYQVDRINRMLFGDDQKSEKAPLTESTNLLDLVISTQYKILEMNIARLDKQKARSDALFQEVWEKMHRKAL